MLSGCPFEPLYTVELMFLVGRVIKFAPPYGFDITLDLPVSFQMQ